MLVHVDKGAVLYKAACNNDLKSETFNCRTKKSLLKSQNITSNNYIASRRRRKKIHKYLLFDKQDKTKRTMPEVNQLRHDKW